MKKRPLGVTIIAILQIIGALLSIFIVIGVPVLLYHYNVTTLFENQTYKLYCGYVFLMTPLLIILAIGLLKGIYVANIFTVILQIVSLFISLFQLNFLSIFFSIVIVFYLTRPHVKEYFLLN